MTEVEGFRLSGEEVEQLKVKTFTISSEPFYEEFDDLNNAGRKKKKLVVPIKFTDTDTELEWLANKTSQKKIIASKGRELKDWIGFEGEFTTMQQSVSGRELKVIYLK